MDLLNAALLGLLFMVGAAGVAGLTGPLIVIGTEGESVSVKCYSNQHIFSNSAFWCRFGLYGKCHQIIRADDNKMDTKVNIEMVHSGFEIKINKITASDAGQYQCGLSDYYDETHKVELKVLPAPGLKGPMRVTALVDRSVEVKCQYSQKYNSPFYKKYFCKWTSNDLCNKLTSYTRPKVTIKDNDSSSLFDATLSDLVKNDAGRYACGISDQYNMEITSPVELVLHTDIKGNPKVTGAVGMSVVMTCEYAKKYKDSTKYWCKTNPKHCFYQSERHSRPIIQDHKWKYLFTLEIYQVEVADAGSYECVIVDSRNAFLYFEMELAVTDYPIFTEQKTITEYRGKSIKIKCHYSQTYNGYEKIWCKEEPGRCLPLASSQYPQARVAFEDDRESGTLIVTMYDLTVNDTGCYKCKSRWYTKSINCPVNLQVLDLEILKVQNTMEKTVGSPAMLECHYKPQYVEYEKYWCKLEINGKCQSVDSNRDGQKRWEVNDKTNNYTLTLYTRTLTMEDAGQYQCGIRRSEYPIDTVQVQLRVLPTKEEDTTITHQTDGSSRTANSGTRIIAWLNENKIFLIIIGVLLVLILIIVVLLIARMIRRRVRLTHNDKDNSFGVRLRNVQNTPAVYPEVQSSQQMASIGTSVDIEESSSDSSECSEDTGASLPVCFAR
ncbi:polymeric immunoglobulin receptor-like isoform X2 [Polypterus senegalus]|uniref:polymeric immunoglobulin receptor-like isoform X2 n=1 Tax=Polypterus senegalus TaxID=55291 RepID=UPI001965E492|nr:polymeric immunoglobulin receptor-like isoform X2 [Polypterus senegalus]